MARILLIGGSGFLSGAMARAAIAQGDEVWTVTRGKRAAVAGAHPIVADRKDQAAFAGAVAAVNVKWDLVVDCIGFNSEDARQDVDCFADRAGHVVFVSTDSVLSPFDRPWKLDETFDRFHDSPYGKGKREAEEVLLAAASRMPITILRPCHILGPGSQLGCLPEHARDPQLIDRIRRGEPLRLVGDGYFLQQPVYAPDLWIMARSCLGNPRTQGQIYLSPGPDVVDCRGYYQIIAEILQTSVKIEEVSITEHLRQHPGNASFCCHRVYSTDKAVGHGVTIPATPLREALTVHIKAMLG